MELKRKNAAGHTVATPALRRAMRKRAFSVKRREFDHEETEERAKRLRAAGSELRREVNANMQNSIIST